METSITPKSRLCADMRACIPKRLRANTSRHRRLVQPREKYFAALRNNFSRRMCRLDQVVEQIR
jgi:hypothetical protein